MTDAVISLLVPTRGRRAGFQRFAESAFETATNKEDLEIVARIDDDDLDTYGGLEIPGVFWVPGPRITLSECWNDAFRASRGEIFGHMGDDIIFRTPGWDQMVRDVFDQYQDKIVFVHGDDGGHPNGKNFGTHGFLHQRWVWATGYFVPPYFSSDWADTWNNDVANALDRRVFVDILTEHMHFVHGKGILDKTHQERLARGARDNVEVLYQSLAHLRRRDVAKLRLNMYYPPRLVTERPSEDFL